MVAKPKTARQIAASRRNIVKAQKRSAELRRGGRVRESYFESYFPDRTKYSYKR